MSKRQRSDSVQERMVEGMDERQQTLKRASQKNGKVILTYKEIPVTDLKEGDSIALKVNENTGRVLSSEKIRELVHDARGCRNTHVNGNQCWDRGGLVNIVRRYTQE